MRRLLDLQPLAPAQRRLANGSLVRAPWRRVTPKLGCGDRTRPGSPLSGPPDHVAARAEPNQAAMRTPPDHADMPLQQPTAVRPAQTQAERHQPTEAERSLAVD